HARRHSSTLIPGRCRHRVAGAERRGDGLSLEGAARAEGADDQPGAHLPEGASTGDGDALRDVNTPEGSRVRLSRCRLPYRVGRAVQPAALSSQPYTCRDRRAVAALVMARGDPTPRLTEHYCSLPVQARPLPRTALLSPRLATVTGEAIFDGSTFDSARISWLNRAPDRFPQIPTVDPTRGGACRPIGFERLTM